MRQWTQWGPLAYGNALCGSYLISLQGLALQLLQCEKEKKRRGRGGRKEGAYKWEGGGQRGFVNQVGQQNRTQIILWPTVLRMVAVNPNRDFSRFPHMLVRERNYFSFNFRDGRTMCMSGGPTLPFTYS